MTSEEREDLRQLTVLVNEGFRELRETQESHSREVRSLIESRRKEDHAAHVAIYARIEENRAELSGKVDEVASQQIGDKAVRKWVATAAALAATWVGIVVSILGLVLGARVG